MPIFDMLFAVVRVAELTACICAMATWRKWRGTPWRWFSFYLMVIVIAEGFGEYARSHDLSATSIELYQFAVIPLEFTVMFLVFYATAGSRHERTFPLASICIYLAVWLIEVLFLSSIHAVWLSFSYMTGTLLLTAHILRFFQKLVVSEAILSFKKNMMVWVCIGWLLFYLGSFPLYGLNNSVAQGHPQLFNRLGVLAYILNVIMYLIIATGYIWSKPTSPRS